jgi:hypothetical protein
MFREMALKEWHETRGVVLLILIVYVLQVADVSNWNWDWQSGSSVIYDYSISNSLQKPMPFLDDGAASNYWWFVVAMAVAIGLRQTLGESVRGTWSFLLPRPMSRRWLIGAKLLTGLLLYFVCGSAVILFHGWRSATPGVYAAPFFWWMTVPWWETLLNMTVFYLSVFLVGIRPARWYGTRLLPLVPLFVVACVPFRSPVDPVFVLLADAALLRSIFFVAQTRDYS